MPRHRTKILIPAYMNASRPYEVDAYQTREGSHFAVCKPTGKAWDIRHVKSGLSMYSLMPRAIAYSLNDYLAAIASIEAHTEIDLAPLDASEFSKGFTKTPSQEFIAAMRAAVHAAFEEA